MRVGVKVIVMLSLLSAMACASRGAAALPTRRPAERVEPGIEVLLRDSLHLIRGRRVGLVTNQTGVDARGEHDVERLRAAGVQLVALFSPEHGFRGAADPGAAVATARDSATGLPIYSLYGRTLAPTREMLAGIDVLLVDLQDVGARYYTYISTTIEVMRAAATARLPVVILDRPNPIGGRVQGNVLDPRFASFVGRLRVPMRHGLTLGELARLADAELAIGAMLHVVPAAGWRRSMGWTDTPLPWIPPSPNLREPSALWHYPGTCLFEGTNLSVGRGTSAPFELIGSPWLDTSRVRTLVGDLPGLRLESSVETPRRPGDGKYADTAIAVLRLRMTDEIAYDPTLAAVKLLTAIRAVHPTEFRWIPAHFDRLAGTDALRLGVERGEQVEALSADWAAAQAEFARRAAGVRIYPE